jgi:hypothetical protein
MSIDTPPPPRLLEQVRAVLRRKHYSLRTGEAYVGWVKRFVLFHDKRHPREMGRAEVEVFLTDLLSAVSCLLSRTARKSTKKIALFTKTRASGGRMLGRTEMSARNRGP